MPNLIFGSHFIQQAMLASLWFVCVGLVVAAHTVQAAEGQYALKKDMAKTKLVSSDTHWQLAYRPNTNTALNRSKDFAPAGTGFSGKPQLLLVAEPKQADEWSINIQKQIPDGSDCSTLSSLICFDSKAEQPGSKPLRDSLWVVWRKVFHF